MKRLISIYLFVLMNPFQLLSHYEAVIDVIGLEVGIDDFTSGDLVRCHGGLTD